MSRRVTVAAVLLSLAASTGLAACGGDEVAGDVVPRETPELAVPGEGTATLPPVTTADGEDTAATTDTTDTTSTDASTPTSSDGTVAPATSGGTAAPQTQTPSSGGTAAPQTQTTPAAGGTTADPGGFSDFCTENPGACDN